MPYLFPFDVLGGSNAMPEIHNPTTLKIEETSKFRSNYLLYYIKMPTTLT